MPEVIDLPEVPFPVLHILLLLHLSVYPNAIYLDRFGFDSLIACHLQFLQQQEQLQVMATPQ